MKKEKKKKSAWKIIIIVIIVLVFSVIGITNYYLNRINYVSDDANYSNGNNKTSDLFDDNGVLNLLITGSDSRAGYSNGNTDTIIILSINKNNEEIIMTSIMRDLEVAIPDYGTRKVNAAVPYGGHTLLMETLYDNFTIDVEKYIAIDFYSFIKIIDAIGGIEIEIKSYEINECNKAIRNINTLEGDDLNEDLISSSGIQLLNGKQALSYSRVRYAGNADYERTSRQRTVLSAVINKVTSLDLFKMLDLINTTLPEITTNLEKDDIFALSTEVINLKSYSIIENRIPLEGENVHITDFTHDIDVFDQLVYKEE